MKPHWDYTRLAAAARFFFTLTCSDVDNSATNNSKQHTTVSFRIWVCRQGPFPRVARAQIAVLDIWSDVIMPELNQLLFKTGEMARGQAEIAWHVFAFG
jgi:hypothetical protein